MYLKHYLKKLGENRMNDNDLNNFKMKLTPFPKDDNAFTRYKWYKENEEILNEFFNKLFEEEFEKYIFMFCNISDI